MPLIRNRQDDFAGKDFLPLVEYKVTYKDVFSMNYLIFLLHEWFVDEGWATRADQDFPEKYYLQREHPQNGQEVWVRWRIEKDFNKYFNRFIDVDIHAMGLKEVEVLLGGQKVKANKGEIEIAVKAVLQLDPGEKFAKDPLLKHVKYLFYNRIIKGSLGAAKGKLIADAYDLQSAIKTYLKLQAYGGEAEARMFFSKKDVT